MSKHGRGRTGRCVRHWRRYPFGGSKDGKGSSFLATMKSGFAFRSRVRTDQRLYRDENDLAGLCVDSRVGVMVFRPRPTDVELDRKPRDPSRLQPRLHLVYPSLGRGFKRVSPGYDDSACGHLVDSVPAGGPTQSGGCGRVGVAADPTRLTLSGRLPPLGRSRSPSRHNPRKGPARRCGAQVPWHEAADPKPLLGSGYGVISG